MKKIALITGCSSGIGQSLAEGLLERGWQVVATARKVDGMARLALQGADCQPCDVTVSESVEALFRHIRTRYGRLDLCINNAGFGAIGPLCELPIQAIERQFDTNVIGVLRIVQGAVPLLRASSAPVLASVGSLTGVMPSPFSGAYAASKAAVHACDEVLRMELAPFGIRVVTIQPGAIRSEFSRNAERQLEQTSRSLSLYRPYMSEIRRRAWGAQQAGIPVGQFTAQVLPALLQDSPPDLIRVGTYAVKISLVQRFVPAPLRRWLLMRRFGLLAEPIADSARSLPGPSSQ